MHARDRAGGSGGIFDELQLAVGSAQQVGVCLAGVAAEQELTVGIDARSGARAKGAKTTAAGAELAQIDERQLHLAAAVSQPSCIKVGVLDTGALTTVEIALFVPTRQSWRVSHSVTSATF
jgi:hypothetical protein